jgi:hypothetical protein
MHKVSIGAVAQNLDHSLILVHNSVPYLEAVGVHATVLVDIVVSAVHARDWLKVIFFLHFTVIVVVAVFAD